MDIIYSFQNFIVRLIPNHPLPLETRIWKLVVRALCCAVLEMVQFTPKIWLTIDLSFLVQSFKETFLVQSFKETLQYCDEWRNSHQAGSQVRSGQSVSRSVSQSIY